MTRYKHLPAITGFFVAALILSNLLGVKIFTVFGISFPVSVILFPLSFVFGDILTEVYGYSASRRVVWTGFISLIAMAGFFEIAKALPPAPFWHNQEAFETIYAQTPRIVAGSIVGYFCGEFLNSFVLAKMKVQFQGKRMWWRFVASTLVGEFVDTAIFCTFAFSGVIPTTELLLMILSAWVVKVLWEVAVLPLSMPFAEWLKKAENEDKFDTKTNFNPFHIHD